MLIRKTICVTADIVNIKTIINHQKKQTMKKLIFSFAATAFLMIASIVTVRAQSNVIDVTMQSGELSKLSDAIKNSGLTDKLKTGGPYTVFAPNNAAFEQMPENELNRLMKNKNALSKLLACHIVGGTWNAALLMTAIKQNNGSVQLPTMGGEKLTATVEEGKIKITDANGSSAYMINSDIAAGNGIIHVIDEVVQPAQQTVTKK